MTTVAAAPPIALPIAPTPSAQVARRRRAFAWNLGAMLAIWSTSLFVVWLWVLGGGIDALLALDASSLNALGRLTGLVASNLLLYQVLLMARVPLFEKGFGRDALIRVHRLVGFWSLWAMLAHIVLLVAGYAAEAGVNPFVQLWEFVWDYPGMLLATVGTVLVIGVAVTSIRAARRRMRYESWHLLHLYAYLGVGIALPHQLWTGADFISSPAATAYWWTLWGLAAASVLVFRIGMPLARSLRHRITVTGIERDGDRGVTVRMGGRRLDRLGAEAGQFFVWRFLDGPGWSRGHPFSLSADPARGELVISARVAGDGTARLAGMKPGTRALIEGPYGRMTGAARDSRRLLMIGAGAGVAPLVSLLEGEDYAPGTAILITRDRSSADGLRQAAIADLVRFRGIRHVPLDGPRAAAGSAWLPRTHSAWGGPDVFRHLVDDLSDVDAYVCGPDAWMDAVCADLRAAGVPAPRIHTEAFSI
ncbi:ferric reductase-like transmembrane domain-containing protein [Planococcus sp. APC 4015]|nr:ferric reductase-like transmembrane domain-containing protein [Planococcus sp. APC 4015]